MQRTLIICCSLLAFSTLVGCELIADFDRSKIVTDSGEGAPIVRAQDASSSGEDASPDDDAATPDAGE
jgi:hypothetical protein